MINKEEIKEIISEIKDVLDDLPNDFSRANVWCCVTAISDLFMYARLTKEEAEAVVDILDVAITKGGTVASYEDEAAKAAVHEAVVELGMDRPKKPQLPPEIKNMLRQFLA